MTMSAHCRGQRGFAMQTLKPILRRLPSVRVRYDMAGERGGQLTVA